MAASNFLKRIKNHDVKISLKVSLTLISHKLQGQRFNLISNLFLTFAFSTNFKGRRFEVVFRFLCQTIEVIKTTTINQRSTTWFVSIILKSLKCKNPTRFLLLLLLLPKQAYTYYQIKCDGSMSLFSTYSAWNSPSITFDCLLSINCCPAFFSALIWCYIDLDWLIMNNISFFPTT